MTGAFSQDAATEHGGVHYSDAGRRRFVDEPLGGPVDQCKTVMRKHHLEHAGTDELFQHLERPAGYADVQGHSCVPKRDQSVDGTAEGHGSRKANAFGVV